MVEIKTLVLILYFSILAILSVYGFHRYFLLYLFLKNKNKDIKPKSYFKKLPTVTIQLPIYNEMYVVRRLVDAVCRLDYPKELIDIQVLDDSIDESQEIAKNRVEFYREKGFNIKYFHRENRRGFKAGALEEGLKESEGEFVAIFDADFIPTPDFLKSTIHYFTDDLVAMVQARWGHINRDYSLLTKVQSIFLDGHFMIEHIARNRSGRFFNFNGTAGIWRKVAIYQAGGWGVDTLAEDLDLSYRTQLLGWKFIYLPEFSVPAELPVDMNGFKSQQFRWAKGSIQTAKKILPVILKSRISFWQKLEAFFHLTGNLTFLLMAPLSLLVMPTVIIRKGLGWSDMIAIDFPLFMFATASFSLFYLVSQKEIYTDWEDTFKYLPFLMSLGIGLAINNAWAVLEALMDKKSEFVRTPKYGIESQKENWLMKKYRAKKNFISYIELLMGIYFTFTVILAFKEGIYMTIPFLLLFQSGYLYMAFYSLIQNEKISEFFLGDRKEEYVKSSKNFGKK
ncbi:MAG: cellulose synthase family protein [Acidobacteriota bacterium]